MSAKPDFAEYGRRGGRPRRCPPCPYCGSPHLRQYSRYQKGSAVCYRYLCRDCGGKAVWCEGAVKAWARLKKQVGKDC